MMLPSRDDIAKFISIAPEATEGKALIFLQGASSLDEAINQFYENPNRYPNNAVAGRPDPRVQSDVTDAQALPPSYDSHISSVHRAEHAPHKNIVTEAGDVRARDEVRLERQNTEYMACTCEVHQYRRRKAGRVDVQEMWSKAVMYPGLSRHSPA
ncbi:hypothetical protein AnigIFM49718_000981 [Aspergillus niger]|nr:hypothetical protein AnigIFM49718_000981 [Aspergillus niger]